MKHITIEDWEKVRLLSKVANVGDSIDNEIINKFLSASSPTFLNSKCLQIGEPQRDIYDSETDTMKPTHQRVLIGFIAVVALKEKTQNQLSHSKEVTYYEFLYSRPSLSK